MKRKLKPYAVNTWKSENRFIYIWPTLKIMRGEMIDTGAALSWLWFTVGARIEEIKTSELKTTKKRKDDSETI